MNPSTLLLIIALLLFVGAAAGVPASRLNLTAAGLACWVAAELIPKIHG